MIFKTFDSKIDKWTSKIGIFGKSFNELGTAVNDAFKSVINNLDNFDENVGFWESLKNNLFSKKDNSKDWIRNSLGDIISKENIDSYIKELDLESAKKKLEDIFDWENLVKSGEATWGEYFETLKDGTEKYIPDLIKNTDDLSKLTGEDLVDACNNAREAALAHNEEIRNMSFSAKAGQVALQGLAIAGNVVAGVLISMIASKVIEGLYNLANAEENAKEATENFVDSYKTLQEDISTNKKTLSDLQAEYDNLSEGVDSLGRAVSLTNEEYDSYKNLISQISEIMPNLAVRYNENGEAIGFVKGKLEDLNAEYDKYQKKQAKDIIANGFDDDTSMKDVFKNAGKINVWNNEIKGQNSIITHNNLNEDEVAKAENKIQTYQNNIDLAVYGIQDALNVFAQANDDFYNLTETQQNYLSTFFGNINQGFVSWQQLYEEDNSRKFVNDMIAGLLKNKNGLADAFEELFSFDYDTTDLNPVEIQQEIDKILFGIAKALGVKDVGDLKISLGFKFVDDNANEYAHAVNKFKEKNSYGNISSSSNSKHNSDIDDFTKENKVTIEELEQLEEQGYDATTSIETLTSALNAMRESNVSTDSTSIPKTFKQAWNALGTTGDEDTQKAEQEAKEELLELAKAGELTPEVLENNKTFADLLQSVGNSAAIAADKINKMVKASDQLSSMKTGISSISDVLAEKKENLSNKKTKETGIGADTLAGFDAEIKGLDSWENFEETLGNGKSSMEECQKAANKLATEWVNSNNFLSQLNNTNKDYYISTLKEMGVKNAEAVVTAALTKKEQELDIEKKWLAAATKDESNETKDLSNATAEQIEKYADENEWVEKTKNAVYALALQKQTANGVHLNTSTDIDNLIALVDGIGGATDALTTYQNMLKHGGSYSTTEMANAWEKAKNQVENAKKKSTKVTTKVDVNPSATTSSTTSSSDNSSNSKSNKNVKQSFDWLERKVSTLTNRLDLLKAKIENVFTVKKKNSIIDQEITKTNKLIKTYQKQAKVYKKQAKSSAKSTKTATGEKKTKLSSGLQKKIQNGQIKGTKKQLVKTYGEKKANAIEEYQSYWDKHQEALTNVQSAKTSKRELKIQKKQNYVDKFDARSDKYDAQIENAKTAKEKNDLEEKKLTSTKKSYNYQIKIAKLEKDSVKVATLKAKKTAAIREIQIEEQQNLQDEADAYRDMLDAQIENTATAKEKNTLLQKEQAYITSSYNAQIAIAKLEGNTAKQYELEAQKQKELLDNQIEQQQNLQDEADAYRDMLESQKENATTAQDKNAYLAKEVQYINQSYDAQIKAANLQKDTALAAKLEAERQQELLNNANEQLQNLSDEHSAQYNLNQQLESNANTAKEKNKYETASRENLKSQYAYEIQIARNNGDITEEKRLQAELEEQIAESYKKQIENLKEEYDLIIGMQDARKSTISSQISALQANGYNVAAELYKEQQEIDLNNYNETLSKISDITAEMQNLDPESQDYKNYLMDLESYKQEAWGYQQAWAEAQQAINDINLSKIEYIGTLLGYQANQLEHIQNILGHSDFTLSDKDIGGLTIEGLSSAAMTLGQMKNNSDQIANKWDQIAEINRQIDADEYVGSKEQAEEDIYNLIKEIEGLEEANYDFGESIKNMVIDSLNSLSDALEESISKYKDALQAQKDLYDYRKKVADQLKSIASLEKQLAALEGSDTEEARARIQKLKIELEEEQQDLKDTEYEKYIQDQEEMLDRVSDDFQDFIANVTDMSVSEICVAVGNAVSDHKDDISQAIIDAFAESDAIKSVADNMKSLGEIMSAIDFSTNITLNTDSSGKVTGMSVNGEEIDVPSKDNGMSNVVNDIENSTGNSEDTPKKMRSAIISYLLTYASNYIPLGSSRINSDPLNQYIYPKYHKMLDDNEEDMLLQYLGIADSRSEQGALSKAVEKMKELGFSQGGMVSHLNKVALDNGDDGWATLKRGESVLTPAQTEQFRKLTENLVPLNNLAEKMRITNNNLPSIQPQNNVSTTVRQMDIHLDGSNVVDADSFIKTLHNPKVLQEISNGVSSQLGTVRSNRLGRF